MNPNNKLPRPFQEPEGYFDDFGTRLSEKLAKVPVSDSPVFMVTSGARKWMRAAAAIAIIAGASLVFVLMRNEKAPEIVEAPIPEVRKPAPDTTKVMAEDAVIASIEEDAAIIEPSTAVSVSNSSMTLSEEEMLLEEAGLIVCDVNDGLFNQFNIGDE